MIITIEGPMASGKTRLLNEAILPWLEKQGRKAAVLDGAITRTSIKQFLAKNAGEQAKDVVIVSGSISIVDI